jgi:hypothetical protein
MSCFTARGADKKGREPITRLWEEGSPLHPINGPKIVNGVYKSRYNFELDRKFTSLNVIGFVKNNRLHYAEHMIKDAEDLP